MDSGCRQGVAILRPVAPGAKIIDMQKQLVAAANLLTVGLLLIATAIAQQTPASTSKAKPAAAATATSNTQAATPATAAGSSPLATEKDKRSYAIGMNIGESLKMDNMDLDPNILTQALKDAMTGGKLLLTDAESKEIITRLRAEVMAKRQAEIQQKGEANKAAGQQFLAANKSKEGVVALPSGLQYKILKEGTGPKPTSTDTVVCNYRGTLIDGTEFDSSYKRGEPATFPVNGVIKGWTEALQLMPVGSKWQLYIPSDLAYGERGAGADIAPNSALIFDVELLSIKDQKEQK